MRKHTLILVALALVASSCGRGATTAPKPAHADLQTRDGYALDVVLSRKGAKDCVRTSFRHPAGAGYTSVTYLTCDQPQGAANAHYDRAVYRWSGDDEALLVDFPRRCTSLRIGGHRSKVAFSCSRLMPGVRITAIPEDEDVQVLDGGHKFDFDLRRPCTERQGACTIYQ